MLAPVKLEAAMKAVRDEGQVGRREGVDTDSSVFQSDEPSTKRHKSTNSDALHTIAKVLRDNRGVPKISGIPGFEFGDVSPELALVERIRERSLNFLHDADERTGGEPIERSAAELLAFYVERYLDALVTDAVACASHTCSNDIRRWGAACDDATMVGELKHAAILGVEVEVVPKVFAKDVMLARTLRR